MKMRCLTLLLALAALLLSCAAPDVKGQSEAPFAIVCGTACLTVGMSEAAALEALGEPLEMSQTQSCAGQGTDRLYRYAALRLYVFAPTGGEAHVSSVTINDDRAATDTGLTVGTSEGEVVAALGEPSRQTDTTLTYLGDDAVLTFTLRDGYVSALTLSGK